ncbi:MAG: hypothetical protein GYB31_19775 [Bacteroidetes bacterium]|nr:hypothetical protein [Bacteroidota bacterium]
MEFGLKDLLYIIGIVVSAVISFLSTRYKIKEYIRDKIDDLKSEITELKLSHSRLSSKDELQQQVLDQIGKQVDKLIPQLINELKEKKQKDE